MEIAHIPYRYLQVTAEVRVDPVHFSIDLFHTDSQHVQS